MTILLFWNYRFVREDPASEDGVNSGRKILHRFYGIKKPVSGKIPATRVNDYRVTPNLFGSDAIA
jgi:hypothetical protein